MANALAESRATVLCGEKFSDPRFTADGEERARVSMLGLHTLWVNTGTLCNIECAHCYIESSPLNDRLLYIRRAQVKEYYREAKALKLPLGEIGFTGGEPFMNPDILGLLEDALAEGHRVLVLTNAMRPMMRKRVQEGLLALRARFADHLILRISLDHYCAERHDEERGKGSWAITLAGMRWLAAHGFPMHVAGRTMWGEPEAQCREGFAALFAREGFSIDAEDRAACMLFPEMDAQADVPEITTRCWKILGKDPGDMMCAFSRMIVWRKGAAAPSVVACTLLPYDSQFDLGATLEGALAPVRLNHPHCAKFCVLGGARCAT